MRVLLVVTADACSPVCCRDPRRAPIGFLPIDASSPWLAIFGCYGFVDDFQIICFLHARNTGGRERGQAIDPSGASICICRVGEPYDSTACHDTEHDEEPLHGCQFTEWMLGTPPLSLVSAHAGKHPSSEEHAIDS